MKEGLRPSFNLPPASGGSARPVAAADALSGSDSVGRQGLHRRGSEQQAVVAEGRGGGRHRQGGRREPVGDPGAELVADVGKANQGPLILHQFHASTTGNGVFPRKGEIAGFPAVAFEPERQKGRLPPPREAAMFFAKAEDERGFARRNRDGNPDLGRQFADPPGGSPVAGNGDGCGWIRGALFGEQAADGADPRIKIPPESGVERRLGGGV